MWCGEEIKFVRLATREWRGPMLGDEAVVRERWLVVLESERVRVGWEEGAVGVRCEGAMEGGGWGVGVGGGESGVGVGRKLVGESVSGR